jgi:hypothetical protein
MDIKENSIMLEKTDFEPTEYPAGHKHQAAPKLTTMAEWATQNEVDLAPVSHVLNGVVEDFNNLDLLIQGVALVPEAGPEVVEPPALSHPLSDADRARLTAKTAEPYAEYHPVHSAAFTQQFLAIQQASRNLRSKFQALTVPVKK